MNDTTADSPPKRIARSVKILCMGCVSIEKIPTPIAPIPDKYRNKVSSRNLNKSVRRYAPRTMHNPRRNTVTLNIGAVGPIVRSLM